MYEWYSVDYVFLCFSLPSRKCNYYILLTVTFVFYCRFWIYVFCLFDGMSICLIVHLSASNLPVVVFFHLPARPTVEPAICLLSFIILLYLPFGILSAHLSFHQ